MFSRRKTSNSTCSPVTEAHVGFVMAVRWLCALILVVSSGCCLSKSDPQLLPGCLKGGMADSTILQRIYTQMAAADFDPPRSYARQLNKDLKSVEKFVEGLGLNLPVVTSAIERYRAFTMAGNEMEDGASISRFYGS